MKGFRRAAVFGRLGGLAVLFAVSPALAADGDGDASRAQTEISNVDRESAGVAQAIEQAKAQKLTAEQRIANGELLYRSKDYTRAVVVFSEILEEYPETSPAYPDALWLLGETFYA